MPLTRERYTELDAIRRVTTAMEDSLDENKISLSYLRTLRQMLENWLVCIDSVWDKKLKAVIERFEREEKD